jgi:predicted metal-dependent HD superfamily phosphohydrolase
MSPSADEVRQRLGSAWRSLLRPLVVPEPLLGEALADLSARYGEASRSYHNLTHLSEVLTTVDGLAAGLRDATAVRLAAWFHDAVYDSRANDNEDRSATLAEVVLGNFGLPQPLVTNVARLVRLTKTHVTDPGDSDGHALLDADLAILGAAEGRYDEYACAIRREYAWVTDEAYREGRGRVLAGFLNRPRLYLTDALSRSHEQQARRNMQRELTLLQENRKNEPTQDAGPR